MHQNKKQNIYLSFLHYILILQNYKVWFLYCFQIQDFIKVAREQATSFRTNHIMMTMGSDFNYQGNLKNIVFFKIFSVRTNFTDANMWYKNLDKLIKNINMNSTQYGMHLLYSTPSCYLKVKHTEFNWVPSNGVMLWPSFLLQKTIFFS